MFPLSTLHRDKETQEPSAPFVIPIAGFLFAEGSDLYGGTYSAMGALLRSGAFAR